MKLTYSIIVTLFIIIVVLVLPLDDSLADDTDVVINEIMYNPSHCADSVCEYIEIVNTGSVPVDVSGWEISDNSGTDTITAYHVGSPTVISSGGYAVITDNVTSVSLEGGIHLRVDDASIGNGLDNSTDTLRLSNGIEEIDRVIYSSAAGANGNGSSLECANPFLDNSDTANSNWGESSPSIEYGTPGTLNSIYSGPEPPVPEPMTIILISMGLCFTIGIMLYRRQNLRLIHLSHTLTGSFHML